jgi:hypothetical protein
MGRPSTGASRSYHEARLFRDWSPPRRHRRYHEPFTPDSSLRAAATAYGREEAAGA